MQLNKNQATEVNFKDLVFYLLYRWRSILLAALICALALCGFQYLSIKSTHDAGKQTKEDRQYQLDLQKYREDLEGYRNTIQVHTKLLQGQNVYMQESIYFQMDSQAVWTAINKYLVKVDQSVLDKLPQSPAMDPADSILSVYSAPLSGATEDELREAFGTEQPDYVDELVTIGMETSINTVRVTVKAATKEQAEAGIALLDAKIRALAEGKAQEIEKHTLLLISEEMEFGTDSDLSGKQEAMAKSMKGNQEILQDAREQLDDLTERGEPQAPGMHLPKMAVIGFILGAAVMLFLYAALYIFRGRINQANEVAVRYHLPVFGVIRKAGNLYKCRGLDRHFARWELGKNTLTADKTYDNICALLAQREDSRRMLLVSSLPEAKLAPVREALLKRLPDRTVDVRAEMLSQSDAIDEAVKADAVILVEEQHVSRIRNIDRMAEALIISGANVIGSIVL